MVVRFEISSGTPDRRNGACACAARSTSVDPGCAACPSRASLRLNADSSGSLRSSICVPADSAESPGLFVQCLSEKRMPPALHGMLPIPVACAYPVETNAGNLFRLVQAPVESATANPKPPQASALRTAFAMERYPHPRFLKSAIPQAFLAMKAYLNLNSIDFRIFTLENHSCASGLLARADHPSKVDSQFSRVHAKSARNVFSAVESFCRELQVPARHDEIPTVLALREPFLSDAAAEMELDAIRLLCGRLQEAADEKRKLADSAEPLRDVACEPFAPAWFSEASGATIKGLSDKLDSVSLDDMLGSWLHRKDGLRLASVKGSVSAPGPAPSRRRMTAARDENPSRSSLRLVQPLKAS